MHTPAELNERLTSTRFGEFQEVKPPDPLYHYTSQAGLLSIIKTGELWATKVQYMNDSTEFGRAVDLGRTRLLSRSVHTVPVDKILTRLDGIANINICSVSFCRNPDLLSQWRGYSRSGSGYAIGFYSGALLETAKKHGCRLGRCIYDEETQIHIIDELIDQINRRSTKYSDIDPDVLLTLLSNSFAEALIEFGAFFKDIGFQEEDEWRLVTDIKLYRELAFEFRLGKSMLIPYYRLDVSNGSWKDKIAHVMVGPCPHPLISKQAITGLLVNQSVTTENWPAIPRPTHPPVDISKILYRSW